jgi:hypothetical protein
VRLRDAVRSLLAGGELPATPPGGCQLGTELKSDFTCDGFAKILYHEVNKGIRAGWLSLLRMDHASDSRLSEERDIWSGLFLTQVAPIPELLVRHHSAEYSKNDHAPLGEC